MFHREPTTESTDDIKRDNTSKDNIFKDVQCCSLPSSWHVRTKENIARVRRDEALAAEQEKIKEDKRLKAEHEAKINFLRRKADDRCKNETSEPRQTDIEVSASPKHEHVNFFKNIEEDNLDYKKDNAEYLKEKKEEQEKYEKKIGYLTYLGQDTNEALGKKNWYDVMPDRQTSKEEINMKSKILEDPLKVIQKYTHKKTESSPNKPKSTNQSLSVYETYKKHKSNKHKKKNKHKDRSNDDSVTKKHKSKRKRKRESSESDSEMERRRKKLNLEKLRQERLKRERREKLRTEQLLAGNKEPPKVQIEEKISFKQKFNSQYNPDVAKQNYM